MIINRENMDTLATGFQDSYMEGLTAKQALTGIAQVANELMSGTAAEVYAWLKQFPQMKEWVGERVVDNVEQQGQTVKNRDWELTIGVDRNHIQDDQYGVYGQLFSGMGAAAAGHQAELVFDQLKGGFDGLCFDGQNYFDSDHPVGGGTVSNVIQPASDADYTTPWYLCDLSMAITRPIVLQMRKRPDMITRMDKDEDPNVFMRKEFLYGIDARYAAAYGFWQGSVGVRKALNTDNYKEAYALIESQEGDQGRPLGLSPTHLIVPPSLRKDAMEIVNAMLTTNGGTNVWRGTTELIVSPWLT